MQFISSVFSTLPRNRHGGTAYSRFAVTMLFLSVITGVSLIHAHAENNGSLSLEAGYTKIGGYYSDRFLGAPGFRVRCIPLKFGYFYPDLALSFASYRVNGSRGSQLNVSGFDLGAQGFNRFGSFTPFAGAAFGLRYFYFNGERTGEKIHTLKPSFGLRGGVIVSLNDRLSAEVRSDYTLNMLSGERFDSYCISMGISYRFGAPESGAVTVIQPAPDFYGEGLSALRAGQISKSRELLAQVPSDDPLYSDARKLISEINDSEKAFNEAETLLAENKKIEALPLMEKASRRLPDAAKILQSLRNELKKDISQLEKSGIAAYEAKDYTRCISIMQKVLAIDPSNQTARTYYERAKKREEALRKLR